MQRSLRMNELQLLALSEKALHDNGLRGHLFKRSSDNSKWQLRWFVLFQNILFYFENETSNRPSGLIFLEGSYCDKVIQPSTGKGSSQTQNYFTITYRKEGSKQYELKAETETECNAWVHAIDNASFSKTLLQKEELEQKHLHLVQIVESEKTAKWQYTQQCEELTMEIKKLRAELLTLKREWRLTPNRSLSLDEDSEEIRKIKKVQSFFRGWLCRRRWKQIVIEYINSPHAENMRKRNSLVFRMVEAEEEYLEQLQLMVSCFLRPFKMAASSQKPPCSHDEVNSIFLNSETVMFLHQIFLKGLTARMECWPTLVLGIGDLFDMLLPMLCIYQEYVRNHHFSLQVLAECKQREKFAAMLRRLEEKPLLQGRTLETFLTYPMHQVPRYIITLHELLAHTPHNHVERKSLENARIKLEELSRQMHDEVSETENIRNNLAIERIIVGGCDILLDVNNVFIRKGSVIQVLGSEKLKFNRSRIGSFRGDKEIVRQCFLFTNHMLLCTRTSGGKLTLLEGIGKIPLSEATLIEDPNEQFQFTVDDCEGSLSSASSHSSECGTGIQPASVGLTSGGKDYGGLDFKIIVDSKTGPANYTLHLVAPTMQEKAAWTSDISQCIDNVHFNDLFHGTMSDSSSVTMPHSIRNDPRLFKDDVDIRFSRTLNSCKLPQIRYASPERLFERLTDLRFLSIDFLNTFLLTYRVFTDGVTVLEALKRVHYNPDLQLNSLSSLHDSTGSLDDIQTTAKNDGQSHLGTGDLLCTVDYDYSRRISTGSMITDINDLHRESVVSNSESTAGQQLQQLQQLQAQQISQMSRNSQHWRLSYRKFEEEQARDRYLRRFGDRSLQGSICSTSDMPSGPLLSPGILDPIQVPVPPPPSPEVPYITDNSALQHDIRSRNTSSDSSDNESDQIINQIGTPSENLQVPVHSHSCDTLTADQSYPNSPLSSATSSATLVGSDSKSGSPKPSPIKKTAPLRLPPIDNLNIVNHNESTPPSTPPPQTPKQSGPQTPPVSSVGTSFVMPSKAQIKPTSAPAGRLSTTSASSAMSYLRVRGAGSKRGSGSDTESMMSQSITPRSSFQTDTTVLSTPRSSFQHPDSPQMTSKAGVVVTSSRASSRRSSTASAASAFAVATAASSNPPEPMDAAKQMFIQAQSRANSRLPSAVGTDLKIPNANRVKRESMISTAATMRVLNVLRHWVSKHSQDFENDPKLLQLTTEFLEELVHNTNLLPAEHKAAVQLLQMISKQALEHRDKVDLDVLLSTPLQPSKDNIETLSALEIAEVMTYLDHKIFVRIQSEEFLGQAWMKENKTTKAFHILLMTRHFNDISRLVASEIMRVPEIPKRVAIIEKWAAVADICRCLHNFNGVLQICAAFTNSSVFRLKRTWEKVCKTTKQTIDKLQTLVSTDGRFRNMREALHRCDPPCIPYLGMYLTDLSFIEEGTPNFTDEGLLNFSKMRMIAHVIREIRHFQQTPYKIEHNPKVTNYLLDTSRHLPDEELYQLSLCLEPRLSRLGTKITTTGGSSGSSFGGSSPSHYSSAT